MNLRLEDQDHSNDADIERRLIKRLRQKPKHEESLDEGKKEISAGPQSGDAAEAYADISSLKIDPDKAFADYQSLNGPQDLQTGPVDTPLHPDAIHTQVLPASDIQAVEAAAAASAPSLIRSNDPYYDYLWWHQSVHAADAWKFGTGKGAVVAVVDTGVDILHEDLTRSIWTNAGEINGNGLDDDNNGYVDDFYGWNFVSNTNNIIDDNGHGTHVSGIIAATANNGIGISGIAPDAKILPVKIADNSGGSSHTLVLKGIKYAVDMGADVINVSMGEFLKDEQGVYDALVGPTPKYIEKRWVDYKGQLHIDYEVDQADYQVRWAAHQKKMADIREVYDYAVEHGSLIIFAAGNDSVPVNASLFPGADWFGGNGAHMVVGAMSEAYGLASFSNSTWVDWSEPGSAYDLGASYDSKGRQEDFSALLMNAERTADLLDQSDQYIMNSPLAVMDGLAPGVNILSLRAGGTSFGTGLSTNSGYTYASGTSMAAPIAAGIAALLVGDRNLGFGRRVFEKGGDGLSLWDDPFLQALDRSSGMASGIRPIDPLSVPSIMRASAVDLDGPLEDLWDYDLQTGHGLFDAFRAMTQRQGDMHQVYFGANTGFDQRYRRQQRQEILYEPDESGAVAYIYADTDAYDQSLFLTDRTLDPRDYPEWIRYRDGRSVRINYEPVYDQSGGDNPLTWKLIGLNKTLETEFKAKSPVPTNPYKSTHYTSRETEYDSLGNITAYRFYDQSDGYVDQVIKERFENGETIRYSGGQVVYKKDADGQEFTYNGTNSTPSEAQITSHWDPVKRVKTYYERYPDRISMISEMALDGSRTDTRYTAGVKSLRESYDSRGQMVEYETFKADGSRRIYRMVANPDYRPDSRAQSRFNESLVESFDASTRVLERFDGMGRTIYHKDERAGTFFKVTYGEADMVHGTYPARRDYSDGSWMRWDHLGVQEKFDAASGVRTVYQYETYQEGIGGGTFGEVRYRMTGFTASDGSSERTDHTSNTKTIIRGGIIRTDNFNDGSFEEKDAQGNLISYKRSNGDWRTSTLGHQDTDYVEFNALTGITTTATNGVLARTDRYGRPVTASNRVEYDSEGRKVLEVRNGRTHWWSYAVDYNSPYQEGVVYGDPDSGYYTMYETRYPSYLQSEGGDDWSRTFDPSGRILTDTSASG